MVDVICDTSFLIQIATRKIKNFHTIEHEIGSLSFVVPDMVREELEKLQENPKKQSQVHYTLEFIKKFKLIKISGVNVDDALVKYAEKNRGIIATLDKQLKKRIKNFHGTIISLSNDKIIME